MRLHGASHRIARTAAVEKGNAAVWAAFPSVKGDGDYKSYDSYEPDKSNKADMLYRSLWGE